jgi:hypothetical protein
MDSDSEAGDSITSTNVLLGYAEKEPAGDTTSQLGGLPVAFAPSTLFCSWAFDIELLLLIATSCY